MALALSSHGESSESSGAGTSLALVITRSVPSRFHIDWRVFCLVENCSRLGLEFTRFKNRHGPNLSHFWPGTTRKRPGRYWQDHNMKHPALGLRLVHGLCSTLLA